MNLSESMRAAVDDAPLETSTVDVDRIVDSGRRAIALRRGGIATVALAAALATTLTVPALTGGRQTSPSAARPAPPAEVIETSEAIPGEPMVLSGAELISMMANAPRPVDWAALSQSKGNGWMFIAVRRNLDVLDALGNDPCALPPGATPGHDSAPTPEDTCTTVEQGGVTVMVRRWGYSPRQRPYTSATTVVVEGFARINGGRVVAITLANIAVPLDSDVPGEPLPDNGKLRLTDKAVARLLVGVADSGLF